MTAPSLEMMPTPGLQGRLDELEARRRVLEAEIAAAGSHSASRLHPNLAEVYRERTAEPARVLEADDAAEAREMVRGLVEGIRLVPEAGRLRIEVRGELGAILRLAEGARGARNDKRLGSVPEAFMVQIKEDAGTRNRRYQYITVTI